MIKQRSNLKGCKFRPSSFEFILTLVQLIKKLNNLFIRYFKKFDLNACIFIITPYIFIPPLTHHILFLPLHQFKASLKTHHLHRYYRYRHRHHYPHHNHLLPPYHLLKIIKFALKVKHYHFILLEV